MTTQKENNYDLFKKILKKYFPLIMIAAIITSCLVVYKIRGKKPSYSIKNHVSVEENSEFLNTDFDIYKTPNSKIFLNKLIGYTEFNDLYSKTQTSKKDEDKKAWVQSLVTVQTKSKDDNNEITYTISSLPKEDAKALNELYYKALRETYKQNQIDYYNNQVDLLTKKIEIMKEEIKNSSLSEANGISLVYSDSLNKLADAKIFLSMKNDKFIKSEVTEQITMVGKKQYVVGIGIAILGSVFVVLFAAFIIEYVKDRIKTSKNKRG